MKIGCEVVQDLLPLYHDGVCSKQSSEIVNEHLQECVACKKKLADMDEDIMTEAIKEAKPLLSIQISWNKEKRKIFFKGLAIAICLFLILRAGHFVLAEWECVPMDKDDLVVTELFQTSNGYIHFGYNDRFNLNFYSTAFMIGDDGNAYVECYRPILAKREEYIRPYSAGGMGFTQDHKFTDKDGNSVTVERVYLGILNHPERSILVWEKGMDIRPATAEEEEKYTYTDHRFPSDKELFEGSQG